MNALEYISIIISIVGVLTSVGILLVWFGSFKQKVSQNIKDIDTIEKNQEEIPTLKQKVSQNIKDIDTIKNKQEEIPPLKQKVSPNIKDIAIIISLMIIGILLYGISKYQRYRYY